MVAQPGENEAVVGVLVEVDNVEEDDVLEGADAPARDSAGEVRRVATEECGNESLARCFLKGRNYSIIFF